MFAVAVPAQQMIGIDSEFCNVESFVTGLTDKWPKYLHAKRKTFTLAVCATMFVLSSSMVTNVSRPSVFRRDGR